MTTLWQSRVWYDNDVGLEVTTAFTDATGVRGPTYWLAHWCDPSPDTRVWTIATTGQDPSENCTLLQAAFPGAAVYWSAIPPEALFPLQPGTDPPAPVNNC